MQEVEGTKKTQETIQLVESVQKDIEALVLGFAEFKERFPVAFNSQAKFNEVQDKFKALTDRCGKVIHAARIATR